MSTSGDLQAVIAKLRREVHSLTSEHDLAARDGDLITVSEYLLTRLEQLGVTVSISFTLLGDGCIQRCMLHSLFSDCPVTSTCVREFTPTMTAILNSP